MIRRALVVGLSVVALLGYATSASATASHKHHRVPACAPLRNHFGPQVWTTSDGSLMARTEQLICSAADHATIDVKTWFFHTSGPAIRELDRDIATMVRYHAVTVNVLVGTPLIRGALPPLVLGTDELNTFGRATRYLHFHHCWSGCRSQIPTTVLHPNGSIAHSKWITVSKTIFGGPAMMETAANITQTEMTRQSDSAVYFYNDSPMQSAFMARWQSLIACAAGHCGSASPVVEINGVDYSASGPLWHPDGRGASVFFAPALRDPILTELRVATCVVGETIDVLNPKIAVPRIVTRLRRLKAEGCTLHVILNAATMSWQPEPTRSATIEALGARCANIHDKVILVSSGAEVIAGSTDLSPHAISRNDNQTIRLYSDSIYHRYAHYFDALYGRAVACPTV